MDNRKNHNNKASNRGKASRKPQTKKENTKTEELSNPSDTKQCNDASWYALNPQLMKDAASLNFTTRTGDSLGFGSNSMFTADPDLNCVPGICAIRYIPVLGGQCHVMDPANAVNSAAKNIYSYVRHANSGHANYDAPDLMTAILGAASIYNAIAIGQRAYGIARVFDQKNKYTPTAMLTAMGFDAADVMNNLNDFRAQLNLRIARASVIWIPKGMRIFDRQWWMNSAIFRDSDSVRSQFYMYVPANFYRWDSTTETTGSSLQVETWGSGVTLLQYFTMLDRMLDPIIGDEDLGIMFGDIMKAYGTNNLLFIPPISEDYMVVPYYNAEVLDQIHNARTMRLAPAKIVQDANGTLYHDKFTLTSNPAYGGTTSGWILDFDNVVPEPDRIMVATRMQGFYSLAWDSANSVYYAANLCAGTEFPTVYEIYYFNDNNVLTRETFWSTYAGTLNNTRLESYARFSKFNKHPLIMWGELTGNPGSYVFKQEALLGDLDIYTHIGTEIYKMHDTAVLSEYNVPLLL